MSPIKNLRKSLAYVLTFSLAAGGLLTLTTRLGRAFGKSPSHCLTPTIKGSGGGTASEVKTVNEATDSRVSEAFGQLPLSFEENQGQVDGEVKYVGRGQGYTLFLTPTETVLTLRIADQAMRHERRGHDLRDPRTAIHGPQSAVLRMKLSGANPSPGVSGEDEMGVRTNYFIGKDRKRWHTGVPRYERVRYADVYPGVDVIYYGKQQSLEYDFEIAPGADARRIALEFKGMSRVEVESETGDLVLMTATGEVRQHKPMAYQEVGGARREVESRYVMQGKRKVGIEVGEYDRTKRLVIDPILSYSTYLGGSGYDYGTAIAVDSSGYAYVAGATYSTDFPTKKQYQTYQGAGNYRDVFVAKLDTSKAGAYSLLYSTYLGGGSSDIGTGIAVDAAGHVYVTGATASSDFPVLNGSQGGSGSDAFVTKLDTNLSGAASLLYSTYLGGFNSDIATGIAIDTSGYAYVTGYTYSRNFPTKNEYHLAYQSIYSQYPDAFVTKIDTNAVGAASLVYSTYLGTKGYDSTTAIAVDSSGHAYVTGFTNGKDFPVINQYQTHNRGGVDAFVTKIDTNAVGAASLVYSTYLGDTVQDKGFAIAVDSAGYTYVTGYTSSQNFPTKNQYDAAGEGGFVTKLDTNKAGAASLIYSTRLGAYGYGIAIDSSGHAYVTGSNYQYQPYQDVPADVLVTKLDTNATGAASLLYSIYFGGSGADYGAAIALDNLGNAYVTGSTTSTDFPTKKQYQGPQGGGDAFVVKITESYSISGRVTRDSTGGAPLAGVTMTLTSGPGFTPRTVLTASDGTYSFSNLPGPANYKIKPSKLSYSFSPTQLVLYNVMSNQTDENFVATLKTYTVSGRVTRTGTTTGIGEVAVTITSPTPAGFPARTTQTNGTGYYTFTALPAGRNYTLKPVKSGYTFTPTTHSVTNLSSNIPAGAATNFDGTGP